ncbi:metal-dependent hydrolase [Floricoccus tropicus]|uniref:Metal-dependent hydrolase n=1 Tax=Floricoccus tropicus TaxID=1859473 RepID=A0A1E8GM85_9LACT|nr:cyclase family protein [Floricoccus tropicus]OFI49350.1 metal-dependent hydrolase [Floricoccus tropicus]
MNIRRIIDLSLHLNEKTPVYPGDPIPNIDVATTVDNEGYNLFGVFVGSQSGSHVDAPYHFSNTGSFVDEMSLDNFFGKGLLIDVSNKGNNEEITLADIEEFLPRVKENPFVLFRTKWDKNIGKEEFFTHPYVNGEAAQALIDNGIKFLGIDTINADQTGGTEFPVHDLFSEHNLIIGENWANFSDITSDNFFVSAFPLYIHCDGSPVRAVAIEVNDV